MSTTYKAHQVFPQFIAALSEWITARDLQTHKALVRELYARGFEAADAGDFLAVWVARN